MNPRMLPALTNYHAETAALCGTHRSGCQCDLCRLREHLDAAAHYAAVSQEDGPRNWCLAYTDRDGVRRVDRNLTNLEAVDEQEYLDMHDPGARAEAYMEGGERVAIVGPVEPVALGEWRRHNAHEWRGVHAWRGAAERGAD